MIKKSTAIAVLLAMSATPALAASGSTAINGAPGKSFLARSCDVFMPFDDRLPDGAVSAGAGMLWRPCIGA